MKEPCYSSHQPFRNVRGKPICQFPAPSVLILAEWLPLSRETTHKEVQKQTTSQLMWLSKTYSTADFPVTYYCSMDLENSLDPGANIF